MPEGRADLVAGSRAEKVYLRQYQDEDAAYEEYPSVVDHEIAAALALAVFHFVLISK